MGILINCTERSNYGSQLCYLGVTVDHLQPPGNHSHESLVLLPVLASPPHPYQRCFTPHTGIQLPVVTLPSLSPSLNVRGPRGLARQGEVTQTLPSPSRTAHVVLVDVGQRDTGGEKHAVGDHVGDSSERGGAGHIGQETRVLRDF